MSFIILITLITLISLISTPNALADTNVVINEIMYDLAGTDSDREWIEVANLGSDFVDLTSWRFEEGGTQHTLVLKQGTAQVASGSYAVIVDNYEKFLQDNPGFSGTVFDSSFSLSNTGENLRIRDAQNGNIVYEVTYSSDWGAAGDGNTLQRKTDNSWIAAVPTPGLTNSTDPAPSPTPTPSSTQTSSTQTTSTSTAKSPSPTPRRSPSPSSKSQQTEVISAEILGQKAEASGQAAAASPKLESPTPTPQAQSSSRTKIASYLAGSGLIVIGLSVALFLWYHRNLKKKDTDES